MAEYVVLSVVQRIAELLVQEAWSMYWMRGQVKDIMAELRRMQCFLRDADSRKDGDDRIRNWVSEIREVAYDLEDVMEGFILQLSSVRTGDTCIQEAFCRFVNFLHQVKVRFQIGRQLERLTGKISKLTMSLQTYGVRDLDDGSERSRHLRDTLREGRRSYPHVVEHDPVGLDLNTKLLLAQLVATEDGRRHATAICGMGGLGKTTLAKKIYNDPSVRGHFECFSWAFISQQFKSRDIWQGILIHLAKPDPRKRAEILSMMDDEVAEQVHSILQERRCLVILDDLWKTQDWDRLKPAFPPFKSTRSTILITSRNVAVAQHMDPTCYIIEPKCLNHEQSWELLQQIAFSRQKGVSDDTGLNKLGKEMVKHCSGLPLAIVVLGGILTSKTTRREWQSVNDNIKSYINGKEEGEEGNGVIWKVLGLSYDDLPYQLKPCFLLVGNFPEDFEIPKRKLIHMWVAEGFIETPKDSAHYAELQETLEEEGERYLTELVNRCVLQVEKRTLTGRIKSCRVHDLMRDMCLLKAKEENFLEVLNLQNRNEGLDLFARPKLSGTTPLAKVRRLSVLFKQLFHDFSHSRYPRIRSLTFFNKKQCEVKRWELIRSIFRDLKFLRIFLLEDIEGFERKLPKELGSLLHLRFLSLRDSCIDELPVSIGNLKFLQTLDVHNAEPSSMTDRVLLVPNVLYKMESLRHLYLPERCRTYGDEKVKFTGLSHLQTVVNFPGDISDVRQICQLTTLRKLLLCDAKSIVELLRIFRGSSTRLCHLKSLYLTSNRHCCNDWEIMYLPEPYTVDLGGLASSCPNIYTLRIDGQIWTLPSHHHLPQNLTRLILYWSELAEDPMPTLGKLPNLMVLRMWRRTYINKLMNFSGRSFPKLKHLELWALTHLEELKVEDGAMPNLIRFDISESENLRELPEGLKFLSSLREMEISYMPLAFTSKLYEGGADFHKVRHLSLTVVDAHFSSGTWRYEETRRFPS